MPAELDLDAVFGRQDPIVVNYAGRRFPMRLPASLTPYEMTQLDEVKADYSVLLAKIGPSMTPEQSAEMERLAREMLEVLAPDLLRVGITFAMQMRVLKHYTDEVEARTHPKAVEPEPTGEESTQP